MRIRAARLIAFYPLAVAAVPPRVSARGRQRSPPNGLGAEGCRGRSEAACDLLRAPAEVCQTGELSTDGHGPEQLQQPLSVRCP